MGYSVIIPVYNCRETLTACVESIRAAQMTDLEILLIDDGSADGSGALCDALALRYPEVRAFHQPHRGVSAARNRGLAEATKEWILFADGDDTLDPEGLRAALQDSGDLLLFGATVEHFHRGVCWRREVQCCEIPGVIHWQQSFGALFAANILSPVWNKAFRRSLLEKHHIRFREDMPFYEDLEFVLRYISCCQVLVNVPIPVYCYRASAKAAIRVRRMGPISEFLKPLEAALANLPIPRETIDEVRLRLYEILAAEKCGWGNGKALCEEFQIWYETLEYKPEQPSVLVRRMLRGQWLRLWFRKNWRALGHALAVEVRVWLKKWH